MAEIKFFRDKDHEHQVYPTIDPDGNYPGVVVGLADNLINHEGIEQTATWNFRTAGGDTHISEGWAELKSIRGNSSTTTVPESIHVNINEGNNGVKAATVNMATFRNKVNQQSTEQGTYNFRYLPEINYESELIYSLNEIAFANATNMATRSYTYTYGCEITYEDTTSLISAFNKNTFAEKVDEKPDAYTFTYDGSVWKLDNTTVTLADYGITLTGSAQSGASFTVNYTSNNWYYNSTIINLSAYGITTEGREKIGDSITINYTGNNWYLETDVITLSQYGITISEGSAWVSDIIQIVYQPEVVGHVRIAHPVGMYTIGMNQFNLDNEHTYFEDHTVNSSGNIVASEGNYVVFFRCVGGNTYTIYDMIANSVSGVYYSEEMPSTSSTGLTALSLVTTAVPANKTVTNSTTVKHYTPSANGYLVVATSDIENLCPHLTWSGAADTVYETYWEHDLEFRYEDEHGTVITDYGMPRVDDTYYDEWNFEREEYYKRVERIENTTENMTAVKAKTSHYIYDADYIYYGIDEEIYHTPQDFALEYKVSDYGLEELIANDTSMSMSMTILYETNLKNKLKDGVEILASKVTTVTSSSTDTQYPSAKATWALDQAVRKILGIDADTFSTTKTYAVGDYVVYGLKLWKCTTAVTSAGAWKSANWTESYLFKA